MKSITKIILNRIVKAIGKYKKIGLLFAMVVFAVGCGDPDIILSPYQKSDIILSGYYTSSDTSSFPCYVCLVSSRDTISKVVADPNFHSFIFKNIPPGDYILVAYKGLMGCSEYLTIDRYDKNITVNLIKNGVVINAQRSYVDETITPALLKNDSFVTVLMTFNNSFSYDSTRLISLDKAGVLTSIQTNNYYNDINLYFNPESLFTFTEITMQIPIIKKQYLKPDLHDSISFHYSIDTAGLGNKLSQRFIESTYPSNQPAQQAQIIFLKKSLSSLANNASVFPLEDSLEIRFNRHMNKLSVEKAIKIVPSAPLNFMWKNDTLVIVPSNSLQKKTLYTMTIDTSAKTEDSIHFLRPFNLVFTTEDVSFFTNYWPMDSSNNVSLVLPWTFISTYSLSTLELQNAFSITPTVDSLEFKQLAFGSVGISHAKLLPDTLYTIRIKGSLTSQKGVLLGEDFIATFRSAKASGL